MQIEINPNFNLVTTHHTGKVVVDNNTFSFTLITTNDLVNCKTEREIVFDELRNKELEIILRQEILNSINQKEKV